MYVYNFDPETRAYLGGTPWEYDQLEPGKPLVPAYATLTPAPAGSLERAGFWPFATGEGPDADGWEVRELPKAPPPPPPPTVEELRAQFEAHMHAARETLKQIEDQPAAVVSITG